MDPAMLSRAQGCLLGQLAGDSLGSLVEFQSSDEILRRYPNGVRELADGGTYGTLAGQPTDDSELALMLARTLVEHGRFDQERVRDAYVFWLDSGPFDVGHTTRSGLRGRPILDSQANGALMRISPLGIFGVNHDLEQVAEWARQDAAITHMHRVCQEASALCATAIAHAIRTGCDAGEVYDCMVERAVRMDVNGSVLDAVRGAAESPPDGYCASRMGWVLIALRNALWQLLHTSGVEEGVVDTIMRGGDTDTNAAICGALAGAVYAYGPDAQGGVPGRWAETILDCRPEAGKDGVRNPRPECLWPVDAMALAERLATSRPVGQR